VQCATPICPKCLIRTPVGMKCLRCGTEPGTALHRRAGGRRAWAVPAVVAVVIAVVLLAVVGLPRLLSPHSREDATIRAGQALVPSGPERLARYAPMGREVQDADLAFTISAVACGATTVDGAVVRTAQGQFCFVTLNVKNDGRSPACRSSWTARTAGSAPICRRPPFTRGTPGTT
jgi:hypothetical protein